MIKVMTQWDCKCGKINPIEHRVCPSCLTPAPHCSAPHEIGDKNGTKPHFLVGWWKKPFWLFDNGFQRKVIDDDGSEIVSVSSSNLSAEELDQQRAVLCLFASAPELLEACKALVSAHENAPFESKSTAFNKALAAISKAEGRK